MKDIAQAKAFYGTTLGLRVTDEALGTCRTIGVKDGSKSVRAKNTIPVTDIVS